jgi:transposase
MSKQRFEHKHDDTPEPTAESTPDTLQRVEIITGAGRRRGFSPDTKARIVLESRAPGAVVSERRHGLTAQQLFGWRREEFRAGRAVTRPTVEKVLIEMTIGKVAIHVREGVTARMIAAVLQAVRATA